MEILLPRIKYTHEIVGTHGGALLPERAPGACSRSKIPRVYRPLQRTCRQDKTYFKIQPKRLYLQYWNPLRLPGLVESYHWYHKPFGGWLWGWFGVMLDCSMGLLCWRQLWRSFLRNLVTANKRSDSFPNTIPQYNSTQRRPCLARNLKMADIIRTLDPMTSLTPAGGRSIHLARERLAESKAIH